MIIAKKFSFLLNQEIRFVRTLYQETPKAISTTPERITISTPETSNSMAKFETLQAEMEIILVNFTYLQLLY